MQLVPLHIGGPPDPLTKMVAAKTTVGAAGRQSRASSVVVGSVSRFRGQPLLLPGAAVSNIPVVAIQVVAVDVEHPGCDRVVSGGKEAEKINIRDYCLSWKE
jgi:hypothetical protein